MIRGPDVGLPKTWELNVKEYVWPWSVMMKITKIQHTSSYRALTETNWIDKANPLDQVGHRLDDPGDHNRSIRMTEHIDPRLIEALMRHSLLHIQRHLILRGWYEMLR